MILDLPDAKSHRYELRDTRGIVLGSTKPHELKSWVKLNDVVYTQLNSDDIKDDNKLQLFLKNAKKDGLVYYYLKLGSSFVQENGEVFDKATLLVRFNDDIKKNHLVAVAHSMEPLECYETYEESSQAKIGSSFGFISAEIQAGKKRQKKDMSIRAFGEGSSMAYWEMYRTPQFSIEGSYRFHMIVRGQLDVVIDGVLELSTFIEKRRFAIFNEKIANNKKPNLPFQLSP